MVYNFLKKTRRLNNCALDSEGAIFQDEVGRLSQQLSDSRVQVAALEAEVTRLLQEKSQQEAHSLIYIQRLENTI